ncbi:MAG TPA: hypothetical protein H9909_10525 [Candidatus Mediterraneibacter norfolkensis]|nr:hypothetical protein [Candidatus Mediterraneibacter norfolkensis]
MRLYQAELKRILKTRSVQILLAAAILLSAVLAYFPCTFVAYVYENESGKEVTLTGREAIRMIQERQGQYQGEITEEKLADAVRQYDEFASRYEGGLPNGIYDERVTTVDSYRYVFAINRLLTRMQEVNADPNTGIAPGMEELTEADAQDFYEQCRQHVRDLIYLENGHGAKVDSAVAQAEMLYDKVKMPFSYYPYISTNAIEYTGLCVLFLVLIGMILMVPLFASDRQNQADQIIKCTKLGKRRLASVRILAGVTVVTVMYMAGIALFLLVMNSLNGWESLKSSVQITVSAAVFLPVTVGELELLISAAGYITLLATVCFTLFLSGRMKSVFASAIAAFVFFLLPMVCYRIFDGNARYWICSILPSGGTGMLNSFTYSVIDAKFAFIGDQAIWTPFLMMAAALSEVILFIPLTVAGWCRKRG